MRFDIYGRYTLIIERSVEGSRAGETGETGEYLVLELGAEGKRRLREDIVIPPHLPEDEIATYLDDLLHEEGRPGASIRRLDDATPRA